MRERILLCLAHMSGKEQDCDFYALRMKSRKL